MLWRTIKPGGLYFIEDMQVAKDKLYQTAENSICKIDMVFPDKVKDILDNLIYDQK